MSVNLTKGQGVNLSKGSGGAGLKRIMVGLGWDEVQQEKKGFFSRKPEDIDCDASAFLLGSNGKLSITPNQSQDVVFFNNLRHSSGAVVHQGDNLTGAGDGDDEQILVDLTRLPQQYSSIIFVVNIYQAVQRKQHFGLIRNAFIRLVDADKNTELARYNLSENYSGYTAMIFGELYRKNGEWGFNAVGQPTNGSVSDLMRQFI
jgi:stress response protein SCP2